MVKYFIFTFTSKLIAGTSLLIPKRGVISLQTQDEVTKIYSNKSSVLLNLVSSDYVPRSILYTQNSAVLNTLLLAQGTQVIVANQTVKNNLETIKRLLFSKLIKELQYSVFDKSQLETDTWFKRNVEADEKLADDVQFQRLRVIRGRGLRYSSLDSLNYNIAQSLKTVFATFTFSKPRLIERTLHEVFVDLHDAEFLYDVGRNAEALQRLNLFKNNSSVFVSSFGGNSKQLFLKALQEEIGFLLFVQPRDNLFELQTALTDVLYTYFAGSSNELELKIGTLMVKLNLLSYVAEKGDAKDLKQYFDAYLDDLRALLLTQDKKLVQHPEFLQQQNQILDNLFTQYAVFYRDDYFKMKILLENKYLDLLPNGDDKNEERQTIISQRIDFLRYLQEFFLDGKIPVLEATKIVSRLTLEIKNIELPPSAQVAIAQIFDEKLQEFAVFYRFLNSPEYLTSSVRGKNYRERFQKFIEEQPQVVRADRASDEILNVLGTQPEPLEMPMFDASVKKIKRQ